MIQTTDLKTLTPNQAAKEIFYRIGAQWHGGIDDRATNIKMDLVTNTERKKIIDQLEKLDVRLQKQWQI